MLLYSYVLLSDIGILDALRQRLPRLYMQKTELQFESAAIQSLQVIFLLHLVVGLALSLASYYFLVDQFLLVIAAVTTALFYNIYQIIISRLRFMHLVKKAAKIRLAIAMARMLIQLPACYFLGLEGYIFSEIAIYGVTSCFFFDMNSLRSPKSSRITLRDLKSGLQESFPFFLFGLLSLLSFNSDRWFVTYDLGPAGLAPYSLAFYFLSIGMIVPNQFLTFFGQFSREAISLENTFSRVKNAYTGAILFAMIITAPLSTVWISNNNSMISAWFEEYVRHDQIFDLIGVLFTLRLVVDYCDSFLVATNRLAVVLRTRFAAVVVQSLLLLICAYFGSQLASYFGVVIFVAALRAIYLIQRWLSGGWVLLFALLNIFARVFLLLFYEKISFPLPTSLFQSLLVLDTALILVGLTSLLGRILSSRLVDLKWLLSRSYTR